MFTNSDSDGKCSVTFDITDKDGKTDTLSGQSDWFTIDDDGFLNFDQTNYDNMPHALAVRIKTNAAEHLIPLVIKQKKCDVQSLSLASDERLVLTVPPIEGGMQAFNPDDIISSLFSNSNEYLCPVLNYEVFNNKKETMYGFSVPREDHTIRIIDDKVSFNLKDYDSKPIHFYVGA